MPPVNPHGITKKSRGGPWVPTECSFDDRNQRRQDLDRKIALSRSCERNENLPVEATRRARSARVDVGMSLAFSGRVGRFRPRPAGFAATHHVRRRHRIFCICVAGSGSVTRSRYCRRAGRGCILSADDAVAASHPIQSPRDPSLMWIDALAFFPRLPPQIVLSIFRLSIDSATIFTCGFEQVSLL